MYDDTWKWDVLETNLVHKDKYAIRYVTPMQYRVTAFKFYQTSCRYSDTVAFYYEHYASQTDAIQAAKNWCLRGELESGEAEPYNLALGVYVEPAPVVESQAW
jgi:hypothetical protein